MFMIKIICFLSLFFLASCDKKQPSERGHLPEKPFVIVVPSYNNGRYCEQNLLSILGQEYDNFRVIYIDDASTDDTLDKAERVAKASSVKVDFICREKNRGSLYNLNEVISSCAD